METNSFDLRVKAVEGREGLTAGGMEILQVNIGLTCNLECSHCHVASSPRRKEQMEWKTMEQILRVARDYPFRTVDITGGAPEMNPHFRKFVGSLCSVGLSVMVRTNLTILLDPAYDDLPVFYRENRVHLVASLPCYLEENVDNQRGDGVFRDSIKVLRILNFLGYGIEEDLPLDLVYNPVGSTLPPPQPRLEKEYREKLGSRYGVSFTKLYTIANMPIGQFLGDLRRMGDYPAYVELLRESFNPDTLQGLMCRRQISVAWDGTLFDCDFNLALRLPLSDGIPRNITDFQAAPLSNRRISTGEHCWGCAAANGSSCGGALVSK